MRSLGARGSGLASTLVATESHDDGAAETADRTSPTLQPVDRRMGAGFATPHAAALARTDRTTTASVSQELRSCLLLVPRECPRRRRHEPAVRNHICFRQ